MDIKEEIRKYLATLCFWLRGEIFPDFFLDIHVNLPGSVPGAQEISAEEGNVGSMRSLLFAPPFAGFDDFAYVAGGSDFESVAIRESWMLAH